MYLSDHWQRRSARVRCHLSPTEGLSDAPEGVPLTPFANCPKDLVTMNFHTKNKQIEGLILLAQTSCSNSPFQHIFVERFNNYAHNQVLNNFRKAHNFEDLTMEGMPNPIYLSYELFPSLFSLPSRPLSLFSFGNPSLFDVC